MPYCPNCGNSVKAVHHYCGTCGQALSDIAESESNSPKSFETDGFLSRRSMSYVTELLNGERELDHDSHTYTQLTREVSAAFADFACIGKVRDLHLHHLWAAETKGGALNVSIDDMEDSRSPDVFPAIELERTLQTYDEARHTDFEAKLKDRMQELGKLMTAEVDGE